MSNLALDYPAEPTLRIEAKFKNARLYNAIAERSVVLSSSPNGRVVQQSGPVKPFCDFYGLSLPLVYQLLNLQIPPKMKNGAIRPICQTLADLLDSSVPYLFPADLYKIRWPRSVLETDHTRMMPLLTASRRQLDALPPTQEEMIAKQELREAIAAAVDTLTPRESKVIRARFGLGDEEPKSLDEICQDFKVGRERIRQIEAKALRKLRHPSRTRKLRGFIDVKPELEQREPEPTAHKRERYQPTDSRAWQEHLGEQITRRIEWRMSVDELYGRLQELWEAGVYSMEQLGARTDSLLRYLKLREQVRQRFGPHVGPLDYFSY